MPFVFNHIPKTAGTTVQYVLMACADPDRVLTSYSRHEINGPAVFLTAPHEFDKYEVAMGHFGEQVRQVYFKEHLALTILREPVSRFKSLFLHHMRDRTDSPMEYFSDDLAAALSDHTQSRYHYMRASMAAYLCARWRHGMTIDEWTGNQDTAIAGLQGHDIVVTTDGVSEALTLVLALYGQPPVANPGQFNTREEFGQSEIEWPYDLEARLRDICPEDFALFDAAKEREAILLEQFAADPLEWIFTHQGHVVRKQQRYALDWNKTPRISGWSPIVTPQIPLLEQKSSRILIGDSAEICLPLRRTTPLSATALAWSSDTDVWKHHFIVVDSRPVPLTAIHPNEPDMHLARVFFEIPPSQERGYTRITFSPAPGAKLEFWLIDFSVAPK